MSERPSHIYVKEFHNDRKRGVSEKRRYAHVLKWDGENPVVHTSDHLGLIVLHRLQWSKG